MGSAKNIPSEGGSGGKRGHSNMEHWFFTEEIKDAARVRRRQDDKTEVRAATRELASTHGDLDRSVSE